MQAQALFGESGGCFVQYLVQQVDAEFELLVSETAVDLAVDGAVELGDGHVLEAEHALHVVVGEEDAVHAAHAGLQHVLEHGRAHHFVVLAFVRLPLALLGEDLIAEHGLVVGCAHADAGDCAGLDVEHSCSWKSGIVGIELRAHEEVAHCRVLVSLGQITFFFGDLARVTFAVTLIVGFRQGEQLFHGLAEHHQDVTAVVFLVGVDGVRAVLPSEENRGWCAVDCGECEKLIGELAREHTKIEVPPTRQKVVEVAQCACHTRGGAHVFLLELLGQFR